jgi:hypothetical protein
MMPQTVPNRPTKGAVAPIVASRPVPCAMPRPARASILDSSIARRSLSPSEDDYRFNNTSEDAAASAEHWNIIRSIINCLNIPQFPDYDSLPTTIKKQFVLPQRISTFQSWQDSGKRNSTSGFDDTYKVPGYLRSITELSSLISDRRGQLATSMEYSRRLMQQFQVTAILVGIVTTILVVIKTGAAHPRLLDVLAIISAAVGTEIASLIAFYNPREEYIRTALAISQLSQLQTEISFALGNEKSCTISPDNSKTLSDWYTRLSSISTTSENFGEIETKPEESGGEAKKVN